MRAAISRRACSASARRAEGAARVTEVGDQPRGGDGDGGLVRDGLEQGRVLLGPGVRTAGEDGQRTERPALADQRRRHDRAKAGPASRRSRRRSRAGTSDRRGSRRSRTRPPGRPPARRPLPRGWCPGRPARTPRPGGSRPIRTRRPGGPWTGRSRSIRAPSATRRRAASSTALCRTAGRSDAALIRAGDLAQRPLDIGTRRQLRAGLVQLRDEPGVGHRRCRVVRERPHKRDVRRAECRLAAAERPERPEHLVAVHEGRGDHRPDADVHDDAVGVHSVVEGRILEVVIGEDHPTRRHGLAEHAGPDRELDRAHPRAAAAAADPGVVREAEVPGRRVDQVDHRPVRLEQTGGLGDGRDQLLVDRASAAVRVMGAVPVGLRGRSGVARAGGISGGRGRSLGSFALAGHAPRIRRGCRGRHGRSPVPPTSSGRWAARRRSTPAGPSVGSDFMSSAHRPGHAAALTMRPDSRRPRRTRHHST